VLAAVVVVGILSGSDVPSWLDAHVKPWVDQRWKWVQLHNDTSPLFTDFLTPIGQFIGARVRSLISFFHILRWPGVLALVACVSWRTGGVKATVVAVPAMVGIGVLGWWDLTLITISLMIAGVIIAMLIGVPLGIWSGRSDRAEQLLRPLMDTAQVLPAYVYLVPLVVAFGIGFSAAVVATVIYATPPAVRLTSLGLRSVPVVSNEVGLSFGSTQLQLLDKVQLPFARKTILLGLNQVIMMAFGVVVIASLVGTGDVGNEVLQALQKSNVGLAFSAGLAIVLAAVALDRASTGQRTTSRNPNVVTRWALSHPLHTSLLGVAVVIAAALISKSTGVHSFPKSWTVDIQKSVNHGSRWVTDHIRHHVPLVGGTESASDFLVRDILLPIEHFLQWLPWWSVVAAVGTIGWASGGARLAVLCALCMVGIGALRDWDLAMITLTQVLVAVVISIALAIPIGVWSGRSPRAERVLRPILDTAQVMPQFVYLIPVLFLVNPGQVGGVIASVIYAIPPGIRLTSHGLREVPVAPREAALSFGATPRQELIKVQLPLAFRSIMLGINQVILMVLATVIIAALVGAGGLGLEAVFGLTKKLIGRGMAGGLSIVLLAVVLDRITQAWGTPRQRQQQ
jgi:glycine betaine/proline transport system permease protein